MINIGPILATKMLPNSDQKGRKIVDGEIAVQVRPHWLDWPIAFPR